MAAQTEVPVLIVGGSLVGLSASMFLGLHGIPCLSVEKHRQTAIHPRAGYFQLRTLELMRIAGIEDRVIRAAHRRRRPGPRGRDPYGASTVTRGDGTRQPSAHELEIARFQGMHVADIARRLTGAHWAQA